LDKANSFIPFNSPSIAGNELRYLIKAIESSHLSGDGHYSKQACRVLNEYMSCKNSLLTHSCTAALEMAAILINTKEGDEIIMPSYTFASTANAFLLRGGVPIFVDVDAQTFNINPDDVIEAITSKTKAIVAVHYAGTSCDMDRLARIAKDHNIELIEDAAQALLSKYNGKSLGSFGSLGAVSFHETKNIISGEGGALLINNENYQKRAEIIREKGTNRTSFFRGEIEKYTWVDIGSSFLASELIAAFLFAQLEAALSITNSRLARWAEYHTFLSELEEKGVIKRPFIPANCTHNGHLYYLILEQSEHVKKLKDFLLNLDIQAVTHYVPLHSSPCGIKHGRAMGDMTNTNYVSSHLLRLPMGSNIDTERISSAVHKFFKVA